jgi:hypothetical protein
MTRATPIPGRLASPEPVSTSLTYSSSYSGHKTDQLNQYTELVLKTLQRTSILLGIYTTLTGGKCGTMVLYVANLKPPANRPMTPSICHPDRPNFGQGYCAPCYQRRRLELTRGKAAECHPERRFYARGLCSACYQAKRRAGQLAPLVPLRERKQQAADLSTLKRLKDIGPKTVSEPRWRTLSRNRLLRPDVFPKHLTPPHTHEDTQALWAWLQTWEPPNWDDL